MTPLKGIFFYLTAKMDRHSWVRIDVLKLLSVSNGSTMAATMPVFK